MSRAASSTLTSALVAVACSTPSAPNASPPQPVAVQDAGIDGITAIAGHDPALGHHLDDDGASVARPPPPRSRPSRPIEIMLRSSPPGALAAVDGVQLGMTPTYWFGEADGKEHEFTFVRRAHAVARYRFVPVQSGLVHARLEPVADGNANLTPEIAPALAPAAGATVVPPPRTVITPDAGTPPMVAPRDAESTLRGPQP